MDFREARELKKSGYVPLAGPYSTSEREQEMLSRVLADARRANKEYAFSGATGRLEVWQRDKAA